MTGQTLVPLLFHTGDFFSLPDEGILPSHTFFILVKQHKRHVLSSEEMIKEKKGVGSEAQRCEFFYDPVHLTDRCTDIGIRVEECSNIGPGTIAQYFGISSQYISERPLFNQCLHACHPDPLMGILAVHTPFGEFDHDGLGHIDAMEEGKIPADCRTVDHKSFEHGCHQPDAVIRKD